MRPSLVAMSLLLAACGTDQVERGAVVDDPKALAQLGFVNEPGMTRERIIARLGEPSSTFEGGRVASYTLAMHPGSRQLGVTPEGKGCQALVIEYDAAGAVVRHSLIRNRSGPCTAR